MQLSSLKSENACSASRSQSGRRRSGSVLIVVLFVMTVLSLAAVSFAYRSGLYSRSARNRAIMAQLRSQAASAVAIAIGRLAQNTNDFDHFAEPWHTHGPVALEDWLADWQEHEKGRTPQFVTDYQVIDEEGKLNLEFASGEALKDLGMSLEQVAALLDWVDADNIAQAQGAEDGYYRSGVYPYHCKNGSVQMLEELLMIRGFGLRDFMGEDANHNGVLDSNEDDGSVSYPPDDADGQLRPGWVDVLTCVGDGRININTAPEIVLEILPLSDGVVSQIVSFRRYDRDSYGDIEDHVFRSQADIDQLQGLTDYDKDVLGSLVTFTSRHFRIFVQSVHVPSSLEYHQQVLVGTEGGKPKILQWTDGIRE